MGGLEGWEGIALGTKAIDEHGAGPHQYYGTLGGSWKKHRADRGELLWQPRGGMQADWTDIRRVIPGD